MKVSLTRVINIIVRFIYLNFLSSKICKQVYLFIIYCYSRRLGAKWNRFLLRLSCDFNPSLAVSFGELTSKNYWLFNNQRQKSHKWHLCFQNNFADIVPFYEWTRQHSKTGNWEPNASKNKGWISRLRSPVYSDVENLENSTMNTTVYILNFIHAKTISGPTNNEARKEFIVRQSQFITQI